MVGSGRRRDAVPRLLGDVARVLRPEAEVADELRRTTLRRLRTVSLLAMPVHLAHLLAFWGSQPATADERTWRAGILLAHGLLLVFMLTVALLTAPSRRRARGAVATLVPWSSLTVVLLAGAGIAAVDQLVTSAITPFLVACVVAGLVLLLPPLRALLVYVAAYLVYAWAIGLAQTDPSIVLSNRVNGLTAVALGLGLLLLQWRSEVRNVVQTRRIRAQRAELIERNRELDRLATHDDLTGLSNRRQFALLVDQELREMRRHGEPASLLLLDLDDFKQVNDRLGHLAGDRLLCELAELLRARLRDADVVARWGGEEFVVLLPRTDLAGARVIAEELRDTVARATFVDGATRTTVSIGVTGLDASAEAPLETAYRDADRAMYTAKDAGRNQVAVGDGAGPVTPRAG